MRAALVLAISAACTTSPKHEPGPDEPPDAAVLVLELPPPAQPTPALACPGAGAYCGGNGIANGDARTLYRCTAAGEAPTASERCSVACERMPAGVDDFCAKACPSPGKYCGDDKLGGPSSYLFECAAAGQPPASFASCGGACVTEPQGYDDFCAGSCSATGAAALQWEAGQLGAGDSYSDLCLGFVNQAYQHAGMTLPYLQAYDAYDAMTAAQATGRFVGWNGACPCGAVLFWSTNACNGNFGHVVICNGDGTVSTSGWPGYGGSPHAPIAWLSMEECGNAPAGYILP